MFVSRILYANLRFYLPHPIAIIFIQRNTHGNVKETVRLWVVSFIQIYQNKVVGGLLKITDSATYIVHTHTYMGFTCNVRIEDDEKSKEIYFMYYADKAVVPCSTQITNSTFFSIPICCWLYASIHIRTYSR